MDDRLYRSRTDRVISGVAGGLAERLSMDPSVVRVVWVILAVVSGGLFGLVYLVMMVVVPEAPYDHGSGGPGGYDPWSSPAATGIRPEMPGGGTTGDTPSDPDATSTFTTPAAAVAPPPEPAHWSPPPPPPAPRGSERGGGLILGLILILLGGYFLLRQYVPQIDLDVTWPVVVVGVGILLVILAVLPDRSRS